MAARAPLIMSRAASSVGPLPAAATTVARHQSAQCLRARGAVDGLFFDQRTARPVHHLLPGAKFEAIGSTAEAALSEGLAQKLQGVDVFDLSGKAVPIVDLWKERKAVVAFARHFGCVLCRKRVDLLAVKQVPG
ncbi:uncharacterized protein [Zea mays]|uniref:Thioredoxin-like protein AAED1 chloroplastic n=1 Tax=Zea mays TaxID=4577 RepID=A0A1D6F2A5_MAIZE|nr:uncharacterized protein LOC103649319 [Zea mays]ONM25565.1 Thioredoxin-like protein AAED1 chloroplastic [Zea mays]|eukprot:XP_008671841.1 uncharacterized protein LOC103649319 [Zea mays]